MVLTPWKKSYDQPRRHIKKQRHYSANKGPSSQGYGFSSVPGTSTGYPTHDKDKRRGLVGKASQVSRGPLPEHLPRNQNLSVYCPLHYTLLTLQGALPDHLSLEKVNLELQLVSCVWKECLSSNPSDGSLHCLTGSPELLQLVNCLQPPNHERHEA